MTASRNLESWETHASEGSWGGGFPTVAVILVNYFKGERLLSALEAVRKQSAAGSLFTVIVDNSTSETEASLLRGAVRDNECLVINDVNAGYAKGCNAGVRIAHNSDYILLLNPDVVMDDGRTIEKLIKAMELDPSIGVLGCLQRNDDGGYVESARNYPKLWRQVARRLFQGSLTEERLIAPLLRTPPMDFVDVDWLQSSFMVIRRALWDAIGGLDEAYYIFMADVAFCRRAHELGIRVVITSRTTVRADGLRASSGGLLDVLRSRALRIHILDAVKYYGRLR